MEVDPNDVSNYIKEMVFMAQVRDTLNHEYLKISKLMLESGLPNEAFREMCRADDQARMRDGYLKNAFEKKELMFCTE